MKIAIMQSYFFPYIGYFQLISAVDKFMLYENVSFRNRSWQTRNFILPKNSKPLMVSVPIKSSNSFAINIREVELLSYDEWKKNFIRKIFFTYKNAAFFDEFFPFFNQLLISGFKHLHEFNSNTITQICRYLDIPTVITSEHSCYLKMENELNMTYDFVEGSLNENVANSTDKKTARILKICFSEGAETYINAIGGIELYDKKVFKNHGIDLLFVKTQNKSYPQFSDEFIPNLSIIDVLMHCGKEKTKELLTNYELI